MSEYLSQEEIDTLLKKGQDDDNANDDNKYIISDVDKDIIGEVGNISMSTAATTLSSILNRKVLITTSRVSCIPFKQIIEECSIPKVVSIIEFKEGLMGKNLLMMDVKDATVIADLMMGGDGSGGRSDKTLSELELSAVAEAMNQMIGSASTAMATMLTRPIDIYPPEVSLWDSNETIDFQSINDENYICKIAFDLNVEGLIQSEIMQIYTVNTVEEVSKIMMMGESSSKQTVEEATPRIEETNKQEAIPETNNVKVTVEKPIFSKLNPNTEPNPPRNLDLIMDVPLEFSVVLGKTKKTIKEVLSFGNGSVVELNKLADEPLEIYVNGKLIAQGEVVVINENFGIRITNILSKEQRVQNLK